MRGRAIICDIDGTIAAKGDRSPYDYTRVHEDQPITPVVNLLTLLCEAGMVVVYVSGREEVCRGATVRWLNEHGLPVGALFMRPAGDFRQDAIVKKELYEREIGPRYDVAFVLDDRNQCVDMWRSELGLPCFQVAYGDF